MFGILDHFRFIPFLVGIVVAYGVLQVYKPEKQIIHQYPHPKDAEDKVFRDHNGTCYTYTSHEVDCDANESTLTEYPIQG
jgi:hypothetical protein